ncbi:MAG: hypothetical protein WBE30_14465 [Candidatus Cybelea sp.]
MILDADRARRAATLPIDFACEVCGERDPIALNADVRLPLCGDHDAIRRGLAPVEEHHIAGRRYSGLTVTVSVNMHRRLTARQRRWFAQLKHLPRHVASKVALLRGLGDFYHEHADAIDSCHRDVAGKRSGSSA